MGKEVNCNDCAFCGKIKLNISIKADHQKTPTSRLTCTVGYRVIKGGKPGPGCDGKFFEPKI